MGVTTDLATNFDLVGATKQTVMSDERDFSRPREPFDMSTAPSDLSNAEDKVINPGTPFVVQVKKFMKNNPLGPNYSGNVDKPIVDSELLSLLKRFESALQIKTGKNIIGTIVSGNSINQSGFLAAIKLLKSPEANKIKETDQKPEKTEVKSNEDIKKFQTFFGLTPTGIVDKKLIEAAKAAEDKIVKMLNNPGAKGLLWDDSSKSFKTNLADLQQALKLISDHKVNKKANLSPKTSRIQAFYDVLGDIEKTF